MEREMKNSVGWEPFGIINPHGQPWTPKVFETEEQAREYLEAFWKNNKNASLKGFRIEKVKVVVTRLPKATDAPTPKTETDNG